jgi:16S rRNA (uracil1498-N3)-methyltransferase
MIRLLHPQAATGNVSVTGSGLHYLSRVHRVRPGDELELFDGEGKSFRAHVKMVSDESVELELGPAREAPRVRPVTVLQGMPKADKLELIIQKACELWAQAVIPVWCERSVVKPSGAEANKRARWQKISDEAARQCGRSTVMQVEKPLELEEALGLLRGALILTLDEEERDQKLGDAVRQTASNQPIALVVGPEGGLSGAERKILASKGAQSVTLGPLVLRTETAALAAISVVRHLDGLLG